MSSKTIVLTGGNKGIGRAIAESLLKTSSTPLILYLTARQPSLGEAAVDEIKSSGLVKKDSKLLFHPLDITSADSVDVFSSYLKQKHDKIDVLINNAGIATKGSRFDSEVVAQTVECNYFGTSRVCAALVPLVNAGGRVVNVSSSAGKLSAIPSPALQKEFSDPKLTLERLDGLVKKFQHDVEDGTFQENGWPKNAYRVSKVAMSALSMILARDHPNLLVNVLDPGWVKTDMAPQGTKTPEQGAKTPTLLAIGDIGNTTGKFWVDEHIVPW